MAILFLWRALRTLDRGWRQCERACEQVRVNRAASVLLQLAKDSLPGQDRVLPVGSGSA